MTLQQAMDKLRHLRQTAVEKFNAYVGTSASLVYQGRADALDHAIEILEGVENEK